MWPLPLVLAPSAFPPFSSKHTKRFGPRPFPSARGWSSMPEEPFSRAPGLTAYQGSVVPAAKCPMPSGGDSGKLQEDMLSSGLGCFCNQGLADWRAPARSGWAHCVSLPPVTGFAPVPQFPTLDSEHRSSHCQLLVQWQLL